MKKIVYYLQKLAALFLSAPIILPNKVVGYSLVKSQRHLCTFSDKSKLTAPYFLSRVELGAYSYISRNSNISNTSIGKFCSIGPNFSAGMGIHPTNGFSTSPMFYSTAKQNGYAFVNDNLCEEFAPITIGHDVFIGANVTVLDGVTIGNGAVIGAGAVVVSDIPPYAVAVGVPAKVVKYRFDKEIIEKFEKMQWWNFSEDDLKKNSNLLFSINKFLENNK